MQVFKVIATYYDGIFSENIMARNKEEAKKFFLLSNPNLSHWDIEVFSKEEVERINAFLAGKSKPA
jgi:hypothetical protein